MPDPRTMTDEELARVLEPTLDPHIQEAARRLRDRDEPENEGDLFFSLTEAIDAYELNNDDDDCARIASDLSIARKILGTLPRDAAGELVYPGRECWEMVPGMGAGPPSPGLSWAIIQTDEEGYDTERVHSSFSDVWPDRPALVASSRTSQQETRND